MSRPIRTVITVVANVLVVVALLLAVRLIALFTAQFTASGWGSVVITATNFLVIPFGFAGIKTPYGGYFSVNTAVTIVVVLIVEWVLTRVRDRA
jgi:hypothetical protein